MKADPKDVASVLLKIGPHERIFCVLTVVLLVFPPLDRRKSSRAFCETLNREWSTGEKVFSYDLYRSQYHLYGDYYLDVVEDFAPVVEAFQKPEQAFCLMRATKLDKFKSKVGDTSPIRVLWDESIGHRDVVLVTNTP